MVRNLLNPGIKCYVMLNFAYAIAFAYIGYYLCHAESEMIVFDTVLRVSHHAGLGILN